MSENRKNIMDKVAHAQMMHNSHEWGYALQSAGTKLKVICATEIHGLWGKKNYPKLKELFDISSIAEVITSYSGETSHDYTLYTAIVKLADNRYLYFRATSNVGNPEGKGAIAFSVKELINQITEEDFKYLKIEELLATL